MRQPFAGGFCSPLATEQEQVADASKENNTAALTEEEEIEMDPEQYRLRILEQCGFRPIPVKVKDFINQGK